MTSVLVTYGTGEGQTAKVARYIDAILSERGFDVTTLHVSETSDVALDAFDGVLVGSPVNNRRHRPEVVEFVELERRRSAPKRELRGALRNRRGLRVAVLSVVGIALAGVVYRAVAGRLPIPAGFACGHGDPRGAEEGPDASRATAAAGRGSADEPGSDRR